MTDDGWPKPGTRPLYQAVLIEKAGTWAKCLHRHMSEDGATRCAEIALDHLIHAGHLPPAWIKTSVLERTEPDHP